MVNTAQKSPPKPIFICLHMLFFVSRCFIEPEAKPPGKHSGKEKKETEWERERTEEIFEIL